MPNEVIPSLFIEELKLGDIPETEPINDEPSKLISDEYVSTFNVISSGSIYSGTKKQNIDLMNALSIKPGWSKNEKWPDGTDVDDYSIVDWLKYGSGINSGIGKDCLLYTSPSPRDATLSRMPSSA